MDTERVKEAKEWLESQPVPDATRQMQRALNALEAERIRPRWFTRYGKQGGLALGVAVTAGLVAFISTQQSKLSPPTVNTTKVADTIAPSATPGTRRLDTPVNKIRTVASESLKLKQGGERKIGAGRGKTLSENPPLLGGRGAFGGGVAKSSVSQASTSEPIRPSTKPTVVTPSKVQGGNRLAALPKTPALDDLKDINADPSAVQARWTQRPLDEEQKRVAGVGAASDNMFIQVPVPQVATNSSPGAALEAWERQKQIVDTRLQKRISIGEKGISFSDLCEKLTKETGVTFKCSRSVADDKVTLFCKARTLRDLMRQVNRIFGYVWDRLGDEPNFEYRLSQPVKNQLVEEELRNKDKNQNVVVWLTGQPIDLNLSIAKVEPDQPTTLRITGRTEEKVDVVLGTTFDITADVAEVKSVPVQGVATPLVVLNTTGKPTLTEQKAGRVLRMSGFGDGFANPDNEKNNAALKEYGLFQKRVSIVPEPTLPKEKLCTSGDVLEAVYKATGKDVMGDYFTLLLPQQPLSQKEVPLFDALNKIGYFTHHRWDWEKATVGGESDWLQFRTAGYYNARMREVPNRLLERWQHARQTKKALDATDMGEIAQLSDPMLDSGQMQMGAELLWGLKEWSDVKDHLRPHWRAFGKLTPERQQQALGTQGIGFRQLKLDNQQELFGLITPQKRPSEFQLASELSAEDFWRTTLQVRYPTPKDGVVFTYRMLGRTPRFWRWELGPEMERTKMETPDLAGSGNE